MPIICCPPSNYNYVPVSSQSAYCIAFESGGDCSDLANANLEKKKEKKLTMNFLFTNLKVTTVIERKSGNIKENIVQYRGKHRLFN